MHKVKKAPEIRRPGTFLLKKKKFLYITQSEIKKKFFYNKQAVPTRFTRVVSDTIHYEIEILI